MLRAMRNFFKIQRREPEYNSETIEHQLFRALQELLEEIKHCPCFQGATNLPDKAFAKIKSDLYTCVPNLCYGN